MTAPYPEMLLADAARRAATYIDALATRPVQA